MNKTTNSTKYVTTAEQTTVWKSNPNATGDYNAKLAVRTLPKGTVVNVISEGQTMTSWSSTPILNIGNSEWIDKVNTGATLTDKLNQITDIENQRITNTIKEPIYYILITTGVLVVSWLIYKKLK